MSEGSRSVRRGIATLLFGVALLAGCGDGAERQRTDAGPSPSTARPTAPPPAAAQPRRGEWWAPNADLSNTRRIASRIDAANVRRLRRAWQVPLEGMYAATPIVVEGVAYTADLMSNVYAIDVRSGRLLWRRDYQIADTGPNGVNVADGRVFGVLPDSAYALDARSGRELWRTALRRRSEIVVMTPGHKDGVVYVSTNPLAGGDVGTLWALDAGTGRRLWGWEQGPRSLWGDPKVNGVGGMWHPPAFDEAGALYASIADPTPWPGTRAKPWGRSRPGPNRWSNSVVKLDARTGRFLWGRQLLPHDFYDWDLGCPIVLATVRGRQIALAAGKMGYVYALDADSGRLLWKRAVGIHNGHDRDSVRAMRGDYSNVGYGRRIYPGDQGGVETQMASDGDTVYVPVNNLFAIFRSQTLPDMQDLDAGTGEVVALDVATGRTRWKRALPHSVYGGATITNDLVLTSTWDGTLWALERRSGRIAWRARLPAGSIAPVAISGDTVLAAGGVRTEARGSRQRLAIVAFRLGGRAHRDRH
ncbi:MAG TPA: PQQ-binding-like beta-propeller repeat protein [Conexibacter sp.]|nr:PQQ-binding-like beta-propeller repeat protein [Conexibacter sp.]